MAGEMALWQQILWGVGALLVFFMFWPGVKAAMEKTEQAEEKDWQGLLIPLAVVVLFVLFLIMMVRS